MSVKSHHIRLPYPIPLVHLLHVSGEVSVDKTEGRVEHIEVDPNATLVALHTVLHLSLIHI